MVQIISPSHNSHTQSIQTKYKDLLQPRSYSELTPAKTSEILYMYIFIDI